MTPAETQFKDLRIGQKFIHAGTTYTKTAPSMAEDERRNGAIFLGQTIVELADDNSPAANPS